MAVKGGSVARPADAQDEHLRHRHLSHSTVVVLEGKKRTEGILTGAYRVTGR